MRQSLHKLPEWNHICVAIHSDYVPHADIDALREVRPIPIIVLPLEYDENQRLPQLLP